MYSKLQEKTQFLLPCLWSTVIAYIVNPVPLNYMCTNAIITEYLKALNIQKSKGNGKLVTSYLLIISPFIVKSNNYLFFHSCRDIGKYISISISIYLYLYLMFLQMFLQIFVYLSLDTRYSLKIHFWGKYITQIYLY